MNDNDLPKTAVALMVSLLKRNVLSEDDSESLDGFQSVIDAHKDEIREKDRRYALLERRLYDPANLDEVTGLPMRKMGEEAILDILESKTRFTGFALLFIDYHKFKPYNDEFKTHDVGDKLLRVGGKLLRETVRGHDFVFRWAGDEKVAILYNLLSIQEAIEVACRYSRNMAEHPWVEKVDSRFAGRTPSVDVGVVFCPPLANGESITGSTLEVRQTLVNVADQNMYRAKEVHNKTGKVVVCSSTVRLIPGGVEDIPIPDDLKVVAVC